MMTDSLPGSHSHSDYKDKTYSSTDHGEYEHAGSGTVGGAGFGNKSAPDGEDLSEQHTNTRYGKHHLSDPYSGSTDYGSGATSGAGFGNKSAPDPEGLAEQHSSTRFGSNDNRDPYSNHGEYGSGSTGGAGFGNKTSEHAPDSRTGKLMEKVGGMMGNKAMAEKGHEKRLQAGLEDEEYHEKRQNLGME